MSEKPNITKSEWLYLEAMLQGDRHYRNQLAASLDIAENDPVRKQHNIATDRVIEELTKLREAADDVPR